MLRLNFPTYNFRFRNESGRSMIFDEIRRKFVVLTPEEWVRQHVVLYLINEKGYPKSHVNVEKMLKVNGLLRRYDIVVFNLDGTIRILVECKSPAVAITQSVFDQIARYNLTLAAESLMITNGLSNYFCRLDYENQQYNFLPDLPLYETQVPGTA